MIHNCTKESKPFSMSVQLSSCPWFVQ
uniref:Uncharacterized protein n=1 Tax=Anguilla anguilla TaxID=7936 RepID=A0A0E9S6G7_ANGAN